MRSSALLVTLTGAALVLAACGSPKKKEPLPDKEAPRATTAPVASKDPPAERVQLHLGNQRALIYTWRGRFPRTVQGDPSTDVEWILSQDEYVKTDDFANAWKVLYCTKEGDKLLQLAACEYVSAQAAKESYDGFVSRVESPSPLAVPEGCEKATAAKLGDHALAAVLSTRYLFIFDRPQSAEVGEPFVKAVVKACFTEPRGE